MTQDDILLRVAELRDLERIIALLVKDPLGAQREDSRPHVVEPYQAAFSCIVRDPNHELIVAVDEEDEVVGVFQISFLPNLTYQGGWRAQIEGVRVADEFRSQGLGRRMIEHGIDMARKKGCVLVQLTTDKQRPDAIRFYESLGFTSSHEGMKLRLS